MLNSDGNFSWVMPTKSWSEKDFCESTSCGSAGSPKYIPLFKVQSQTSDGESSSWVTLQLPTWAGELQVTARATWRYGGIKECNNHSDCTKQQSPSAVTLQTVLWIIWVESVGPYIQIRKNPNNKHGTPKNTIFVTPESLQHNCEQMAHFSQNSLRDNLVFYMNSKLLSLSESYKTSK